MLILPSKLSLPKLPGFVIERERLFNLINEKTGINSLIFQAPAGYGKTVLSIQYLNKYIKPGNQVWIDLDHHDRDPGRILAYIIHGLAQKNKIINESGLAEKAETNSNTYSEIVDNLCLLFQEYIKDEIWLVLDNWEMVDSKKTAEIVARLINHTENHLKIIINSRIKPSFKIQKMRENSSILVLVEGDLRLTFTEFVEAVKHRTNTPVDEHKLEKLWKMTSGWCINLSNIVNSLEKDDSVDRPVSVEDYISEELFSDLDEAVLDKLLLYSTLEIISPETCRILTKDKSEIDTFLKKLRKLSIPMYEMKDRFHYRLHPLVKEAAQNQLLHKFNQDFINDLFQKVSAYHRKENNLVLAIEALIMINDFDKIIEILDKDWTDIVQLNLPSYVKKWLEAIPKKYQTEPLFIKTMSNYLTLVGNNREMLEYLSDKIDYSQYPPGDETLSSLWINYNWGLINSSEKPQYKIVLKSFHKLLKDTGPYSDISMAIFENILSVAAHLELNYATAIKHLKKCMEYMPAKYKGNKIIALQNMGLYKYQLGHDAEALNLLDESVRLAKKENILSSLSGGTIICASIYLATGQYSKTIEMVETCITQMKDNGLFNIGTQMYAERFKGEALWYLGEKEQGIKLIEKSMKASEYHGHISIITIKKLLEFYNYHSGRPVQLLKAGEDTIFEHANEARPIYLADMAIRKLMENKTGVSNLLDNLEILAIERKLKPWKISVMLLKSIYFYKQNKLPKAKQYLSDGLTLLSKMNWTSYPLACEYTNTIIYFLAVKFNKQIKTAEKLVSGEFHFDPSPLINRLLKKSKLNNEAMIRLYKSLAKMTVRGLIGAARKQMNSSNRALKAAAANYVKIITKQSLPSLKIYMLGRFEVYAGGFKCRFSRKKSRQVLQYLLLAPKFSAHEEQLVEQFWSESTPTKGKGSLRTAIKDLRKSLDPYYEPRQESYLVYENQHYKLALPEGSFMDLRQFEKDLGKYKKLTDLSGSSPREVNNLYKSISLYKGVVLPEEEYESYSIDIREYIKNLYQTSLLLYAKLLLKKERRVEILPELEEALKNDPFWRDGVAMLIKVYVQDGKLFKAIKMYRDYESILKRELGITPDESLSRYMQKII